MYFGERTDKYFARWIKASTWDSMHHTDMEHFYLFMRALISFGEGTFDETDFKDKMHRAVKHNHQQDDQHSQRCIDEYTVEALAIVEYSKAVSKRWPDTEVESLDLPLK